MSEPNQSQPAAPTETQTTSASKSTAQIMREQRNMSEEDKQKAIEEANKVDSPGNRCSYCGKSFEDQLKLGTHISEEHAHENELKPPEESKEQAAGQPERPQAPPTPT